MSGVLVDDEITRLDFALDARRMGPLLSQTFGLPRLACHVEDAKYSPHDKCMVMYRLGAEAVVGVLRWDGDEQPDDPFSHDVPEIGMRAYRFPHDPALPGLPAAVDPGTARAVLNEHLDGQVLRCSAHLLRYRPTRRATLRYDLWIREGGKPVRRVLYSKVYHDLSKASRVHETLAALEKTEAVREGALAISTPAAFLPGPRWVLYEPVHGVELDLLPDPPPDAVKAAGTSLASVHAAGILPAKAKPVLPVVERMRSRAMATAEVHAEVGAAMTALANRLIDELPDEEPLTLIHGDCKPSQFLVSRRPDGSCAVTVLDFDGCGLADPAQDVGAFLASMRKAGRDSGLGEAFYDAYVEAAGRGPGFRTRVAWYEAVGLLRKAQRAFSRAPRSPMALALVALAQGCLERGILT